MSTQTQMMRVQSGFSMIEVLITLVIISIALLGSAGLQAYALKTNQGGQFRNQAVFLVSDIVERMEANKAYSEPSPGYISTLTTTTNCAATAAASATACNAATLAQYDVVSWQNSISAVLPSGTGTVSQVTAANPASGTPATYTITINWVDRKTAATYTAASAAAKTEPFSITTNVSL